MWEMTSAAWLVFFGAVAALFTLDMVRGSRGGDLGTALGRSALWVGSGLLFGLWVWASRGGPAATEYYAAYLLEKALSIDNIFVFVLIFAELRISLNMQHRVLLLGVASALVMRALMIWLGVYLITRFHWVIYPFAVLLLIAALRLLVGEGTERRLVRDACAACGTWVVRIVPVTPYMPDQRLFLHRGGRWVATPLFVALILIETTDIIFALDSIPAVLAITRDPFIVYTSNVLAMLGLRSLYFVLADVVQRFRYLRTGLAAVLCLVAAKMLLSGTIEVPVVTSLIVILAVVLVALAASWIIPDKRRAEET